MQEESALHQDTESTSNHQPQGPPRNGRDGEPRVFTVDGLRQWLGPQNIGRSALYELVRTGGLRSVRVGRRILIPRSAVEDWLG